MKVCPYCNTNIKADTNNCPNCKKSLRSYKIYKVIFEVLIQAPLYLNIIFYPKINNLLIEKFSINNTTLVFIIFYVAWAATLNYLKKCIFKSYNIEKI